MQLNFTESAKEQLEKQNIVDTASVKLVYDTEGCGCAVNGVPQLWLVERRSADASEIEIEGGPLPVMCEKKHEVFFEERMTLDYSPDRRAYVLKSGGQIYNAGMTLIDKR
jgi:uncharacterized protein YqkB